MMIISQGNLFAAIPQCGGAECMQDLWGVEDGPRIERIVSRGQTTPPGEWLKQERDEWVVLLSGAARLLFEEEARSFELKPGDYLLIPAGYRHRVEWTDPVQESIWLAVHC